eukprot:536596-Prorocentrum_minimum.AAC.1
MSTPSVIRSSGSPAQAISDRKQSVVISCTSTNSSNVSRTHLGHSSEEVEEADWLPSSLTERPMNHPTVKAADAKEAAAPAVRLNHRYGYSD